MGVGYSEVANYTNTSSGTASGVTSYGGVGGVDEINSFFSALNWFSKGEQGAWYDPSDFQPNWRRNLLLRSNDFWAWTVSNTTLTTGVDDAFGGSLATTVSATATNGVIFTSFTSVGYSAQTIYIRRKTGGGSIYIRNAANNLVDVTTSVTTIWSRVNVPSVSISGTAYFGVNISVSGDAVDICFGQCETGSTASTYQKITDGIQDYYTVQPQPVLFQDSAGVTPVTAVEQPVGLMLDKSKGLALGAELVTNGDFSNGTTGWAITGNWAEVGGQFVKTGTSTATAGQSIMTVGKTYLITVNIIALSGQLSLFAGSTNNQAITTTGQKSFILTCSGDTSLYVQCLVATATIDNISVKQIAGNHAFQGDMTTGAAAKRPMLSARVNLLTKTEDFSDNVIWIKGAFTSPTAGKIIENTQSIAESSTHQCYQSSTVTATHYTASIQVKPAGRDWCAFRLDNGTAEYAYFNLTGAGSKGTISSVYTASSIDLLPDGYYKLTLTRAATGPVFFTVIMGSTGNNIVTYQGDGVSGYFVRNADLRPTNSGALLPTYQRVNTASDYDTVGFPLYLKANGTSSAMSTNSIDFTATDKMTVVTGVRKLSDASGLAMLMELSNSLGSNINAFFISAPRSAANYGIAAGGTTIVDLATPSNYIAPTSNVLASQTSISAPIVSIRVNGTRVASSSSTSGTGNFGNYPLYLFSRAGTGYFLNGQFYGAIIRGAQSDTASVTQTENYMATKTGITF